MFTTATRRMRPLLLALAGALTVACAGTPAGPTLPRDPGQRQHTMEGMRRQILHKTAGVSAARYTTTVRPDLVRQLAGLGFTPPEIDVILTGVDPSRGGADGPATVSSNAPH